MSRFTYFSLLLLCTTAISLVCWSIVEAQECVYKKTKLELSWNPNVESGITSYFIFLSDSLEGNYVELSGIDATPTPTITYFAIAHLNAQPKAQVCFKITAFSSSQAKSSPLSDGVCVIAIGELFTPACGTLKEAK